MVGSVGTSTAFATFQRLSRADGDALLAKFQRQPTVQKEIEYFKQKAAQLKDPEELFKDRRLLRFIVSAYALDDEINYPGRLRKVLESKIADPVSLANRMTDPRYREMANELMIGDMGVLNFGTTGFVDKLVKRYVTAEYEKDLGNQNPALREAAYFLRKIGTVKTSLEILGDRVLRDVVTYTLDLPPQIALQSIQKQQSLIDSRIDISKFRADGASAVGSAYMVDRAKRDIASIDSTLAIATKAATQATTVVKRIQDLKDSYDRLANIQRVDAYHQAETPVQAAAVPGLTRQSGLLAAAEGALGDIGTHLARMEELITLASDPANAAKLGDYKAEFATLKTKVQNAVAGATFTYDDGDADSIGAAQNLLNGSLTGTISVQIKSTGEAIAIRTHDLSGMLARIDTANSAFQAGDLDAAQSNTDAAGLVHDATSLAVASDKTALSKSIASIPQWVAPLNTARITKGYESLRDAGARLTAIDSVLNEIRAIATEAASRADGADRTDLTARLDTLKATISDLVNTPGSGLDNLLADPNVSYELLNGFHLDAHGRDLNTSVVTPLASGSIATAADAQALIASIDGALRPTVARASVEVRIDTQPFDLAANTIAARAAGDFAYLWEEFPVQQAAAPGLARQTGLLTAADKALGQVDTYLKRMDELVALTRDPKNAANLTTYKTEFAELRTKIQSAITGATYSYDDGDADSTGVLENLLTRKSGNGTLPDAITVKIKSTGETVRIRTHDLSGLLASVDAANAAFQAVTKADDATNLDAAQAKTKTAESARYAASVTVAVDQRVLSEGIASVPKWVGALNTAALYRGHASLRDAGARVTEINRVLTEIYKVAEQSAARADSADRTDLTNQMKDLLTKVKGLVSTPGGTGLDNLLAGPNRSYEIVGGSFLQARGRDLNASVVTPLTNASIATAADAQALMRTIDGTIRSAMDGVVQEIGLDSPAFVLAATMLDPRAALDSAYRTLSDDMEQIIADAAVGKTNLLDPFQSDLTVRLEMGARTMTVSARATLYNPDVQKEVFVQMDDVMKLLEAGAALLPSAPKDASGALAKMNEALFSANRILGELNTDISALNLERQLAQVVVDASKPDGSSEPKPFEATPFAMKFIQKYLLKKDQETTQNSGLASLLLSPIQTGSGSRNSGAYAGILGLAGKSRVSFFA